MTKGDDRSLNAGAAGGLLDRSRTIAKAGFNRWLVPPAALAIHLCIGMAYGFSVFWLPLSRSIGTATGQVVPSCAGAATTFGEKALGTLKALFATSCEWSQFDLGWMFTLFFVLLGSSAAIWGGWLERAGPRKAGVYAALCWCGGLMISALGVRTHQLWMLWLGSGVIGGIGLGLGYISPVSTLIKWFPDRRGMATGMAIMGFGGGALIGSPLANLLMAHYKTATSVGVWQTFVVLGLVYFVYMMAGAFGYRVPPDGWSPPGWTPSNVQKAMITTGNVHLDDAHKTPQFWLIWGVLCLNVSAGIGIIGAASPMLQETFGGVLIGDPLVGFTHFTDAQKVLAAAIGGGFVGLFSLFNIGGRFFWATLSDRISRKTTYFIFFVLGTICYAAAPTLANWKAMAIFAGSFCIIASMYGGGFATVPAYLADIFGTRYVGAIHGRLLTAWSTAGIVGPVIVNYLHDTRVAAGIPRDHVYDLIFYVLAALLVVGFICNSLVGPVDPKWLIKEPAAPGLAAPAGAAAKAGGAAFGIGRGGLDAKAAIAWAAVGLPLLWGIWKTLENAVKIFQ
ncbi:OFA family MFS transporter [Methylocapsa palsarum]|uniref:Nitrate/nitrite transporter NarK n=1 Tax=Methylocapsa palsarum TaxID=1612308 RepID=A0A1I3YUW6_9HYPH|nr:OFA family MFS transporter [Methylocapsa palsarum]SFK35654.1 Nitrate/nitrite transporter NarK [Methylocapsa palsarum]